MDKVLIITYYWPPAGGPGVQRWLNFIKFLAEFNKQVVVYIPENPNYPFKDESFLSEVPSTITILKKPIIEPYKWASIFSSSKTAQISKGIITTKKQSWIERAMLWIRGNFFIPDARVLWVKPSVKFLRDYISKHHIKTIVTTGPPHSLHLIGLNLKQRNEQLRWIADFRDPWTTIGYHSELKLLRVSEEKHQNLEATVLQMADKIITTSPTTKKEFEQKTSKPIKVITNGYLDYPSQPIALTEKFSISHIGSLLSGRNPKVLWETLAQICNEHPEFSHDLELILAGTVSDQVIESIKASGLEKAVHLKGYLDHQQAIALQRSSQLLLLIEIDADKTRGIIPGKFFEYMAAKRPILALGPRGWDVAKLIKQTQTGRFFNYEQRNQLKDYILEAYMDYKNNNLQVCSKGIEAFHRKELTKALLEFIS